MADEMKITAPITVRSDSRERVAFDLMEKIAAHEGSDQRRTPDYWFKLFDQCIQAANGYELQSILKKR